MIAGGSFTLADGAIDVTAMRAHGKRHVPLHLGRMVDGAP